MGVTPARSLPLQHMGRAVENWRQGTTSKPAPLGPDEMQLYSYYRPSLVAGDYEVTVVQNINATITDPDHPDVVVGKQKLEIKNVRTDNPTILDTQKFEVVVPRFSLEPELINSYYPPDGHQDEGRILPHIVLNDPHYPWEINAGSTPNMFGTVDGGRNVVPWVALVVFDVEDLRFNTLPEMTALNIPGVSNVNQQSPKGSFTMQVRDYFKVPEASRVDYQKGYSKDVKLWQEVQSITDTCQVIFPTKKLFWDVFHDPETMKYLAHVRNVNTVGFPDAGLEEMGLFSVVVSSRTGQFNQAAPVTQICHLVSIENVDSTIDGVKAWLDSTTKTGSDRLGLISLFSWVYTALPPNPVNFVHTVTDLLQNQQMFRVNESKLRDLKAQADTAISDPTASKAKAGTLLLDRLQLGYTLTRWRAETGEETAAWNRGPLVPQRVRHSPRPEGDVSPPDSFKSDLPDCSNTSKEFQILDTNTGLMDMTYSSAWQLGKTLAISDTAFSSALMRFRSVLSKQTASSTLLTMNSISTKPELMSKLVSSLAVAQTSSSAFIGNALRVEKPPVQPAVSAVRGAKAINTFKRHLAENITAETSAGDEPFNGFNENAVNNSDWVIIHDWLADKLSLADIPPHYLIPEPSFVPAEAVRFFYIDDFWLDCLIDGALSVANHLDHNDDLVRVGIKRKFNKYLRTVVPGSGIKPQIPCYGFVLRSQMVKTMPDLRIEVKWSVSDPADAQRHPVCRYTKYDDTTLICLLDRWPEELEYIMLAQPGHQQRFSLGNSLTGPTKAVGTTPAIVGRLDFQPRHLYTTAHDGAWGLNPHLPKKDDANPANDQTQGWFNWDTRCMKLRTLTSELNALLQNTDDQSYVDSIPNSCELGLELNDPSYYFLIHPPESKGKMIPKPSQGSTVVSPDWYIIPRDRQLYINEAADIADAPKPKQDDKPPVIQPNKPIPPPNPAPGSGDPPPRPPTVQPRPVPTPSSFLSNRDVSKIRNPPTGKTSQFELAIYADYKPYPVKRTPAGFDPNSYIPLNNVFFFDLIFSLTKVTERSQFELLEIQIDIPNTGFGATAPTVDNEPLLEQNYDGPGVHMLANQRFVPFLYFDSDHLRVQLVPRAADDTYRMRLDDSRSADLGFRLAEANVSKLRKGQFVPMTNSPGKPQWRGVSKITMVEFYATDVGRWPVFSTWEVVKNPVRDPEDVQLEKEP